ncbi:hypothetical protein [Bradymonas sediminis]|uniref:hypothetical protein n=1 Tax=Bradymonas sediminis TaxID=1548548 RepID=UPI00105B527C|nr:hypothetical protein [Bradymonas sediminis]TDP77182.1 hypothetical protein DFR33_10179 [Bradymonas sediminis]
MRTDNKQINSGNSQRSGRFGRIKRGLACLLVAVVCSVPAIDASALDKNQIVQMTKLGMQAGAIKGAIDGAGTDMKLSAEDIGELRAAGVDEEVIEYLEATGHAESTVEEAPVDAPTGPAPADDGAGPSPAPAPGAEEEGETLSQEELEQRISERAEQLNAEKKAAAEREQKIAAEARKLPNAKRMLASGDNMGAARIYLKFIDMGPDMASDEWYEAQFGLASALYGEGILSGAALPLLDVIMAGPQRTHFKKAFGMLKELTKRIGFQPPMLEEMTKFYIGDMNQDFKDEFNYYLGKFFFDYGRNDLAIDYLSKVSNKASDYPEALYVMGIAQLGQQAKMGEALKNFERAIIAGENEPGGNEEILQLGYLALARVFYEVGYYDVALYYYQKIPTDTSRNARAAFETAWTYFVKNDYKRALGAFHTLHSPYYDDWYFPDLYILESTVYLNLCDFQKSKQALAKFQTDYLDPQPRLDKFLTETTEPSEYWKAIVEYYSDKSPKGEKALPEVFVSPVLADLGFHRLYGVIRTLQAERNALKANISTLGEFGNTVLGGVELQLQTKIEEGGILVQQKLSQVNKELQDWDIKATQISFDIDSEEKNQLQAKLLNQNVQQGPQQGTSLLVVADDFTPWPFEGEYWSDEVTNYRSQLQSQCAPE